MKKPLSRTLLGIAAFLLLVIGFSLAKLPCFECFVIDTKISVGNILGMIFTFLVAIVIAWVIEKNRDDLRSEKNLYIERLYEIIAIIKSVGQRVSQRQAPYQEFISNMTEIRTSMQDLFEYLDNSRLSVEIENKEKLLAEIVELKDMLTYTPPRKKKKNSDNPHVTIENNTVIIPENLTYLAAMRINRIKKRCHQLQIDINNA